MFYLGKCQEKGCTRKGRVALKEGAVTCNIHSGKRVEVQVEVEMKNVSEQE
jgi:hypothetical protein